VLAQDAVHSRCATTGRGSQTCGAFRLQSLSHWSLCRLAIFTCGAKRAVTNSDPTARMRKPDSLSRGIHDSQNAEPDAGSNGDPRIRFGNGCADMSYGIWSPWLSSALGKEYVMKTLTSDVIKAFGVGSVCAVGGFALLTTALFLVDMYLSDSVASDAFSVCKGATMWGTLALAAYTAGYYFGPNKTAGILASVIAAFLFMIPLTGLEGKALTVAVVVGLLSGLAGSWRAGASKAYSSDARRQFRRIFRAGLAVVLLCGVGIYAWTFLILHPMNRQVSTHNRLLNVSVACSFYMVEEGGSPESVTDLFESPGRRNVYLEPLFAQDGWGHPIQIRAFDASRGHGSVISYGRDGRAGGDGPDADTVVPFAAISP
jgi:hypothetical protein